MKEQKNKNDILVIQKYKESRIGTISMLIALGIATICYVVVLVVLQQNALDENIEVFLNVVKDILLAVVSIIGTSFLTSIFIEKNRKNIDYTELIANDIFASPEFFSNLTEDNKKKMIMSLEDDIYRRDYIKSKIFQLCREKINENPYEYYYEELNVTITYKKYESYSEKKFSRVIRLRSYSPKISRDKLFIMSYELNPAKHVKNFELKSASMGEKNMRLEIGTDILVKKEQATDALSNKCGYTDRYVVYLCKDAVLTSNEDLVITLNYISRVTDEDNSMRIGTTFPCRKFYVNFIAPEGYLIFAHAFGFLNEENNFPNSDLKHSMQIHFSNWLLPGEGVSISVVESKQEISNGLPVEFEAAATEDGKLSN